MSKFVSFPLQLDGALIVYPDSIERFANTVLDGDVIHAEYFGELELAPSDYFRQRLVPGAIQRIKSAAFLVIDELGGEGGWRQRRADDRAALGDPALANELIAAREAVRAKSNELESAVVAMDYEELMAFDPLPVLQQSSGL